MRLVSDVVGMPAGRAVAACQEAGYEAIIERTAPPWPVREGAPDDLQVVAAHLLEPALVQLLCADPAPARAPRKLPAHVAIICDGNGRWARSRGLSRHEGHRRGTENVRRTVDWCTEIGIPQVTFYALSTENWRRPKDEVDGLMDLIAEGFQNSLQGLLESGVRLRVLGEIEALPPKVRDIVAQVTAATAAATGTGVNLLINYGGRADIVAAARAVAAAAAAGRLDPEDLDEAAFGQHLSTSGLPDPDLIIRTAGDLRLSNFLTWQSAYSELHFTPVYWPAFSRGDFLTALDDYGRRRRRFGGLDPGEQNCSARE